MGKILSGSDFLVSDVDYIVSAEPEVPVNIVLGVENSYLTIQLPNVKIPFILDSQSQYLSTLVLNTSKELLNPTDYIYSPSYDIYVVDSVKPTLSSGAIYTASLDLIAGESIFNFLTTSYGVGSSYSLTVIPPVQVGLSVSNSSINSFSIYLVPPILPSLSVDNIYGSSLALSVVGPQSLGLSVEAVSTNNLEVYVVEPVEPELLSGATTTANLVLYIGDKKEISVAGSSGYSPTLDVSSGTAAITLVLDYAFSFEPEYSLVAGVPIDLTMLSACRYDSDLAVVEGEGKAFLNISQDFGFSSSFGVAAKRYILVGSGFGYNTSLFAGVSKDLALSSVSCYVSDLDLTATFGYVYLSINPSVTFRQTFGMANIIFISVSSSYSYYTSFIPVKLLVHNLLLESSYGFSSSLSVFLPAVSLYKYPNVRMYYE